MLNYGDTERMKKEISIEASLFAKPYSEIISKFDELFNKFTSDDSVNVVINDIKHPYFWSLEKIIKELEKEIEKTGDFLRHKDNPSLYSAMKRYGGANFFRELLHQPI